MNSSQKDSCQIQVEKERIRRAALDARARQPAKGELSRTILNRLRHLPEFTAAATIMVYVDARSEVRTRPLLPIVLLEKASVVVPFCRDDELDLFRLESLEELEVGRFGILEPKTELRIQPGRRVGPDEIDLIVVPGVAFDRHGGRLGHGFAFYDNLLRKTRPETLRIGLAFECQVFPTIPCEPHDIRLDKIVTEAAVYESRALRSRPSDECRMTNDECRKE